MMRVQEHSRVRIPVMCQRNQKMHSSLRIQAYRQGIQPMDLDSLQQQLQRQEQVLKKDNYSNVIARGAAMEIQKFRGSLFAFPVDGFGKDICENLYIN